MKRTLLTVMTIAALSSTTATFSAASSSAALSSARKKLSYEDNGLFLGAQHNNHKQALFLLNKGANLNARNKYGRTPLHTAAAYGSTAVIPLLLKWRNLRTGSKADIDATDDVGNTPLHKAAEHGHIDAVKLLVAEGANTNAENQFKQTPLGLAMEISAENAGTKWNEVINFLVEKE